VIVMTTHYQIFLANKKKVIFSELLILNLKARNKLIEFIT
jgi:hypothetical protein